MDVVVVLHVLDVLVQAYWLHSQYMTMLAR